VRFFHICCREKKVWSTFFEKIRGFQMNVGSKGRVEPPRVTRIQPEFIQILRQKKTCYTFEAHVHPENAFQAESE